MNVSNDVNPGVLSRSDPNRTGPGADAECCRTIDVQCFIESAVGGKQGRGTKQQQNCRRFLKDRYHFVLLANVLHYCCKTTVSPSFSPSRISVLLPFEIPSFTGTLRCPSFCFGSGTKAKAFFWLS